jgi:hypothetical protein
MPSNANVDIYRTFSASSPYPVASTPIAVPQVPGYIKQNVRLGRLGMGRYLHWTHVLYLPPGTDIRSAYGSQLNSWPSAQADTVLVQDYPAAGWCSAFLVVLVQRVNRGNPGDCLRVYLDRVQPIQGQCQQGVTLPCCPNPLPLTVHATIHNVSGCPCIDGEVVALTYSSVTNSWSGYKSVCGGPHLITLGYSCGIHDCSTAALTGSFDGYNFPSPPLDPGCSCSPLNMGFSGVSFNPLATVCPNATVQITVTV